MNKLQPNNLLNQNDIIDTRKETWNTLFCWIDFSKTKWKDKVYNKEQQFWQMPQTFVDWQKETTELLIEKHGEIENLINSFKDYFQQEVYPIIKSKYGDKTLAFRCERLLDNKMIGETSSLFLDLLIFEREYLAQIAVKNLLSETEEETNIAEEPESVEFPSAQYMPVNDEAEPGLEPENQEQENTFFSDPNLERKVREDIEKLVNGKINFEIFSFFVRKWLNHINKKGTNKGKNFWEKLKDFSQDWEKGKIGVSKWKNKFDKFKNEIEEYFYKGSGDNCFFQLGFIKRQAKWKEKWMDLDGLIISTQNRKGWDLLNPYLMLFWFHQKPSSNNALAYRSYFVNTFSMTNPRNLYVVLDLKEDWIWKNYGRALLSPGILKSNNHPIYHERNLPANLTEKKLHYSFCEDLGDKEVYYLDSSFQPEYDLYVFNHPNWVEKLSDILDGWARGTTHNVKFPGRHKIGFPRNIYKLERYNNWFTGFWKSGVSLFLAPKDFYTGGTFWGMGSETSNCFYEEEEKVEFTFRSSSSNSDIINKIYESFNKYGHLLDHSTFQSYFCHDLLEPANLRYLDFKKEGNEWKLKCTLKIKATIAGIYYFFYSKSIEWQLRIEVRQTVPSAQNLKALLTGAAVVVTSSFVAAGAAGAGSSEQFLNAIATQEVGKKTKKNIQTKLLKEAKSVLQDITGEETTFSFGLFDFWSKMKEKQFWGKIYVSNTLKNNLAHNNNQNPITLPLNITFDKLWKVLKKGEYQAEVKLLGHDPGSYLSNKFKEGIIFFEDRSKDFITPELGLRQAINLISYDLTRAGGFISEEIREEEVVEVDRPKGSNYHQRVHYLIEYEDGTKEHWLGLLPMFQDSELADGHTKGTFNLYFDKPVKYFWDVYTCIGCGASGEFNDLHADYGYAPRPHGKTMPTDSWDTLYKDLPIEPWFGDVANTDSLIWCGKNMGSSGDVWAGRKEQRPNGKSFTAAYGFIPTGGVIRWRLGSTGVKIQEIPQQSDFSGLDWHPNIGGMEDIRPTTETFNYGEGDIPDVPDIPENDPTLDRDLGDEPETIIEPDITIEPDAPEDEPDFPEPEVPEPEITPLEPVQPEGDVPEGDTGDNDVPDPDEFPDSSEGD